MGVWEIQDDPPNLVDLSIVHSDYIKNLCISYKLKSILNLL